MNEKLLIQELKRLVRYYSEKDGQPKKGDKYWELEYMTITFDRITEIMLQLCNRSYNQGIEDTQEEMNEEIED